MYNQLGSIVNNADSQYYGQGGGASLLNGLGSYLQGGLQSGYQNPYSTDAAGVAGKLANFNGLQPAQLASLEQTASNAGQSQINTMRNSMGGGANNNAMIQSLVGQNDQATMGLGVQMGNQAANEQLQGLQSAGSIYTGLGNQNLDYLGQMISGLLGTTGQQSGMLTAGMGSLGQMGGQYAGMASGLANTAQNDRNTAMSDFSGAANGIESLVAAPFTGGASLLGGGGAGSLTGSGAEDAGLWGGNPMAAGGVW